MTTRKDAYYKALAQRLDNPHNRPEDAHMTCNAVVTIQDGPTFSSHICGRPVVSGGKCGIHNGDAKRKRDQRKQETALAMAMMRDLGLRCRPILERLRRDTID